MSESLKARLLNLQQQLQEALQSGEKEKCLQLVQQIQSLGGFVHFYPKQQAVPAQAYSQPS